MPRAEVEERTVGHVTCPGHKLNGSVPQCQVGYDAHIAGIPMPQKRVVVDSHVSCDIDAGVKGARAVKADCDVGEDIDGDIDVMEFLVPNDCVIQDPLRVVLHNRCEVEHPGRVLEDTDPANRPVGGVNRDVDDVMQGFRSSPVHQGYLRSVGSVREGEVEDYVFLGCGVEERKRESVVYHNPCAVSDPVRDVDAADLIDLREQLSSKVSVIQFCTPVAHGEIEMQILRRCGVGVSGCHVEDCSVVVGAVDQNSP